MPRWFNIAGPCFADEHYMVPPERRAVEAQELIDQGRWFCLVSERQTGKTALAQWIVHTSRTRGECDALWVDLQSARNTPDVADAMRIVLDSLGDALARGSLAALAPATDAREEWLKTPATALIHALRAVCAASERPVVVLFDEADVLVGAAMVSFLTQPAPWSERLTTHTRELDGRVVHVVGC